MPNVVGYSEGIVRRRSGFKTSMLMSDQFDIAFLVV